MVTFSTASARDARTRVDSLPWSVADVRWCWRSQISEACFTGSGIRARFFRMVERFLVRRTILVVCTSDYYVNDYYLGQQKLDETRYMVLENKLDPETVACRKKTRRRETIGRRRSRSATSVC